jgi:hypothetical protein
MKMLIILLALSLPFLEDIRKTEAELDNCVILLIQPIACHKCYVEIDESIREIENRKFNYYILLESERRVTSRKAAISIYEKNHGLKPDKFIFARDSEAYKKFQEEEGLTYSPVLILIQEGKTEIFAYGDIYKKGGNRIKEILGKMKE